MGTYRKKPVEIRAVQWTGTMLGFNHVYTALEIASHENVGLVVQSNGDVTHIKIQTLEGDMFASPGDFIIRGIVGELYPCRPDIFNATYEPVDD